MVGTRPWSDAARRREQPFAERQVDQDGVRAEQQRGGPQPPVAADGR